MLVPFYAALAAAVAFFLAIPVAVALRVRSQWRSFRDRVAELEGYPLLTYGEAASLAGEAGKVSRFRLFGSIEAIEGPDRVWVRGEGVSALVDLSKAPVYTAPPEDAEAGSVRRLRWGSISSVVEGTRAFVGGRLVSESGRPVFVDSPGESLIVVIHDGEDEGLFSRLIVGGRSPNEYFGYATPLSIALGLIAVSVILLIARSSPFSTVRALVFLTGILPVLPFAPPGLFLFLAYRRLWRRALALRIERDALKYSLPPLGESIKEPSAAKAAEPGKLAREANKRALTAIAYALLCLALAVAMNYALAFIAWRAAL